MTGMAVATENLVSSMFVKAQAEMEALSSVQRNLAKAQELAKERKRAKQSERMESLQDDVRAQAHRFGSLISKE